MVTDGGRLDLSLSDRRAYVHGGDLLDVLVRTFAITAPVSLRIFKLTDAMLDITPADAPPAGHRAAFLATGEGGTSLGVWLTPRAGGVVTERSGLMDADILTGAKISQGGASVANPDPARLGRIAVVLAVAVLGKRHPAAKWLLGDLSCRCYPATVAMFAVKLHHDGFRVVTLSVQADGADWGRVMLVRSQEGGRRDASQP